MDSPEAPAAFRFQAVELARGYRSMAPALLVTWLIAGAPPGPGPREVFLAAVLSVLVVAAAARSRGLGGGRSVLRLALHRAYSHSLNVLLFLLFLLLAAGLGGTLGGALGDLAGWNRDVVQLPAATVAMLPVLWWHWPVLALACVVPDPAGAPVGALWRGPGHTAARRLLRSFGSPGRTALIVGFALLWLGVLTAVEHYDGTAPLPAAVEAASYAVFLPVLTWMATVETHRLVASVPGAAGAAEA